MTTDEEAYVEYLRATWALFTALEKEDQQAIDAIWDAYDNDALLRGWHMVSMRLRQELQHHADHLGCDCGSQRWLEQVRLELAGMA